MEKVPGILDVYQEAYHNQDRYLMLMGGAGSGKSFFAAQKILHRMRDGKFTHRFVVVRKVARTIRNSVYQQLKDVINHEGWQAEFKFSESRLEITHEKGSTIITTGVDDPEKLKSLAQPTGVWIEEATELDARDFRQLDLRLRGQTVDYLQIIFSFNPISKKNFIYKQFYARGEAKNAFYVISTHSNNTYVGAAYKDMLSEMEELDPEYYKVYALAQWGENSNAIIYNYKLIPRMPENVENTLYGLDFGFNNPCALVRVCYYEKDIYLEEVFYRRKLTTPDIIELMNRHGVSQTDDIYADSANPDKIEELKRGHFNVKQAEKSVFNGINKVKEYRIHVVQNSINLLNELDNYVWKTDSDGNLLDEPEKNNDHACDAIRYAIYSHLGKRKQSIIWGHSG